LQRVFVVQFHPESLVQFIRNIHKGDNPKFNQLKIELFKGQGMDPSLNFYSNNGYSFYQWDGFSLVALNDPRFFPFKFFYKGDSVTTTKIKLIETGSSPAGSYLVYLPFKVSPR